MEVTPGMAQLLEELPLAGPPISPPSDSIGSREKPMFAQSLGTFVLAQIPETADAAVEEVGESHRTFPRRDSVGYGKAVI